MTMTAPTWLNLDAFDIPQAAVDELRRTITELRALVPQLDRLNARARAAVEAVDEATHRHGGLPDDVAAALRELTGETELHDVLLVIGWCAAEITQSFLADDYQREEIRAKRAI
jgi:alkylhydroperoxidase family enzyme